MLNFFLIGICILAGLLFRKSKTLPEDAHKGINAWIIYLALPAASFKYLPYIKWESNLLFPAIAPVVVWVFGWFFIKIYSRRKKLTKSTFGGLTLASSLSNTSFIGFPLVAAYFGEQYLAIAIICDQVTFTLLATAGIILGIRASGKDNLSFKIIINKILTFPPLIGCMLALTIPHFINIDFLNPLIDKLAGTLAPLALFSVGLQLKFSGWFKELTHISTALLFKLIIAPFAVTMFAIAFHLTGKIVQVTIFEMAMPTLVTSGVIAGQYNLNPKVANLVIGIGIIGGFFTTGIWWLILTQSGWF